MSRFSATRNVTDATVRKLIEELHAKLDNITKALEPPEDDKAAYVAEMEEVHADLECRNRYLMGELERRDAEALKVERPWWKWWRAPCQDKLRTSHFLEEAGCSLKNSIGPCHVNFV